MHIAVDLGALSGRVILGHFGEGELLVAEAHRFTHPMTPVGGHLRWDVPHILAEIKKGIGRAVEEARRRGRPVISLGVDTWGVDYGLVDRSSRLVTPPVCYRDERTQGRMEEVFREVPRREVFDRTGVQFLELNTLYQLVAEVRGEGIPAGAHRLLLMADLLHAQLGGRPCCEYTLATTSQMVSTATGDWDRDLLGRLGLPVSLLPDIVQPGTSLGTLRQSIQGELGVPPISIVAPAAHDTASAVVGAPLEEGWAFLSSGTWSLVGAEIARPLVTDAAYRHNFTNEGGAAGTIRLLKNVAGMWILESCRKQWSQRGTVLDYAALGRSMAELGGPVGVIEPDDPRFFNPPDMVAEVKASLRESGQDVADDEVTISRVILDSLARKYQSVVEEIELVTGRNVAGLRIVGGGSQNDYLNQATADACGRPVVAGPAEATALGNLAVQAIAAGRFRSVGEARRFIERYVGGRRFEPRERSLPTPITRG
jgi:rhamnulokinase